MGAVTTVVMTVAGAAAVWVTIRGWAGGVATVGMLVVVGVII